MCSQTNERNDRSLSLRYHVASVSPSYLSLSLSLWRYRRSRHQRMFTKHLTVLLVQAGSETGRARLAK